MNLKVLPVNISALHKLLYDGKNLMIEL